jgi:hypothetical protein
MVLGATFMLYLIVCCCPLVVAVLWLQFAVLSVSRPVVGLCVDVRGWCV